MRRRKPPSNTVLIRRILEETVDDITHKIVKLADNDSGKMYRDRITSFGPILAAIHEPLSQLQRLQHADEQELPEELREMILAMEPSFDSNSYHEAFKEIEGLL